MQRNCGIKRKGHCNFGPPPQKKTELYSTRDDLKLKKMVQSRVMRKENPDLHYTNAIYSFLKERAQTNAEACVPASTDAKCKVTLGEPGYLIAAVTRGKRSHRWQ